MLAKIKDILLNERSMEESAVDAEEQQQLALAALLVEMSRADFDETPEEHAVIVKMLGRHFEIDEPEAEALLERACAAMDESVSLFDFTRSLHEQLEPEQKHEVIRLLWRVALIDDSLDKYEDYLVRKIADLLYVSHPDVVRIKHEVMEA